MATTKDWISALRPRTLFLAVATALAGNGIALHPVVISSGIHPPFWIVCALTIGIAIILQLLSNMANDLGDYQQGTDITGERIGPTRTVQSGAITPKQMKQGIMIAIVVAMIVGLGLILIALQFMNPLTIAAFIVLGAACIVAAIKYTAGKNPYGYKGLGDIFSFIFFGLVSVIGTYYLQTQWLDFRPMLPAIGLGLLTVAVLNVNNMRDRDNDLKSGKITIAIKLGYMGAKHYHAFLTIGALICFVLYNILYANLWYHYIYLIVFLAFFKMLYNIYRIKDNRLLDPYLKFTSMGTFALSLLFVIFTNL